MLVETLLHFISAIAIFLAAVMPIYLTIKLKNNTLKKLTLIFSIFILIHSFYHITGYFNFEFLADRVFEPLSVVILILFGIVYSILFRTRHMFPRNMVVAVVVWNLAIFINIIMNNITLILLLVALGIFVWLAVKSRNIKTFQFQMSIFILIWILGEIVGNLQDNGIVILPILQGDVGLEIHTISMIFFSVMIWLRFYYSERSGKIMIEEELGAGSDIGKSNSAD